MKQFIKNRWHKYYHLNNKNRYWHLIIDGLLAVIILTLIITNIYISAKNSGAVLGIQNNNLTTSSDNNQNGNNQNTNKTPTALDNQNDNQTVKPEIIIKPTNIEFQSFARYYTEDGEQLGVGPLPPVDGRPTKYWLFINISGFNHDLEDILISAQLPANVSLTGKSSITQGDNISYENAARKIKWRADNLLAKDNRRPIGIAFEVEIIPYFNQIGQTAILLADISISAIDTLIQQPVTKTNPDIDTNLVADKLSGQNGIIQTD